MSMTVTLDTSEGRALARDIGRNAAAAPARFRASIQRGAFRTVSRAKVAPPTPLDTGALVNSIGADVDGLTFEAGPTVEYGGWVEEGTDGPYPIENAFGRGITVMHPGNQPQPYMGPAFDQTLPKLIDDLEQDAGEVW